jgi:hypothetical protein
LPCARGGPDLSQEQESSVKFEKDMELRRRIKEHHPNLTDEELDKHLAVWGE